jgi:hypothetical protein
MLQNLDPWRQKRDWPIARALVCRFAWFRDGDNIGALLYGWKVGICYRQIE